MSDYKDALERVGSRISTGQRDLSRIAQRRQRRKARRRLGVTALALLIALAGSGGVYLAFVRSTGTNAIRSASGASTSRCETLIPQCKMKRLPNRTLTGNERHGALGPVGAIPSGIISFDDALTNAWANDPHAADAVQVTLGAADPVAMHWDTSSQFFYTVTWFGVCSIDIGGGKIKSSPTTPEPCSTGETWGTVIDAVTGAFVVGGNG